MKTTLISRLQVQVVLRKVIDTYGEIEGLKIIAEAVERELKHTEFSKELLQ